MHETNDQLTDEYLEQCLRDGSDLRFASERMPLPLSATSHCLKRPLFRKHAVIEEFATDVRDLMRLTEEIPERCFGGLRPYLEARGIAPERADVIERGSVGRTTAHGRIDAIQRHGQFQVIEFNVGTDLGGVDSAREYGNGFLAVPEFKAFADTHKISFVDPVVSLAERLRAISEEVVGVDDPLVGIVEESGGNANAGCEQLAEALADVGIRVILCELGELSLKGGKAYARDRALDVALRYFFVDHVFKEPDGEGLARLDVLTEAHLAGGTAFFASFDPAKNEGKATLGLFYQDVVWSELTATERALVERRIPKTRLLGEAFPLVSSEQRRELLEECRDRRTELLLKPSLGQSGIGVCIGPEVTEAEWSEALKLAARGDYVVQEHVPSDLEPVLVGGDERELWKIIWGIFMTDAGYGGTFNRALREDCTGIVGRANPGTRVTPLFTYE